jgi:hypothetical protein
LVGALRSAAGGRGSAAPQPLPGRVVGGRHCQVEGRARLWSWVSLQLLGARSRLYLLDFDKLYRERKAKAADPFTNAPHPTLSKPNPLNRDRAPNQPQGKKSDTGLRKHPSFRGRARLHSVHLFRRLAMRLQFLLPPRVCGDDEIRHHPEPLATTDFELRARQPQTATA